VSESAHAERPTTEPAKSWSNNLDELKSGVVGRSHSEAEESVARIVAIAYPNEGTAEQAQATVFRLEDEPVIRVEQVAVISRDVNGRYHVHTWHDGIPMAGGAIWGGLWGLLFGTVFLIPLAGWAIVLSGSVRGLAISRRKASAKTSSTRSATT
jgi:hypothetical protein